MADPIPTKANTPAPRWVMFGDDPRTVDTVRNWADAQMVSLAQRMRTGYNASAKDLAAIERAYSAALAIEAWHRLPEA